MDKPFTQTDWRCLFQNGKAASSVPVLLYYSIIFPVLKIQQEASINVHRHPSSWHFQFSVHSWTYTEDEARKLGVVGWVKNTRQGTVTGQVQGPEDKVNAMGPSLYCVLYPSQKRDGLQ
ncbi:acylphosphatase-2 isoform X2 [Alligator mississippiensis]|uniref:acylphosphatase-2 isoform X2 n=1 Tax=Alligator mississippiensis TaxID=8496 RepID=UPI002877FBAB|nr:acylphosphatase-2 isoform X2 [Alligator mississippiensis]